MHGNAKLTPRLVERIRLAVAHGEYLEMAAALAGVNRSTLYRWITRGERELERLEAEPDAEIRESEELYLDLCNALSRARATAELRDLAVISAAADRGDWQASAWRLERRWPEKYGRRRHHARELAGPGPMLVMNADRHRDDDDESGS